MKSRREMVGEVFLCLIQSGIRDGNLAAKTAEDIVEESGMYGPRTQTDMAAQGLAGLVQLVVHNPGKSMTTLEWRAKAEELLEAFFDG